MPGVAVVDVSAPSDSTVGAATTTLSPTLEAVSDVAGTVQLVLVGVIAVAMVVVVRRVRRLRRIRRARPPEVTEPTS